MSGAIAPGMLPDPVPAVPAPVAVAAREDDIWTVKMIIGGDGVRMEARAARRLAQGLLQAAELVEFGWDEGAFLRVDRANVADGSMPPVSAGDQAR